MLSGRFIATIGVISHLIGIFPIFKLLAKSPVIFVDLDHFLLLSAYGQNHFLRFYKCKIVVLAITDLVHNRGAGIQQIIDVVLDLVERYLFAVGKVIHKGRSPWILISISSIGYHRIAAVSLCSHFGIDLSSLIQSNVYCCRQFCISSRNMICAVHGTIRLNVFLHVVHMGSNITQICAPVRGNELITALFIMTDTPAVVARHNRIFTSTCLL